MSKIIESIIQNPGKYKLRKHQVDMLYFSENKPNVALLWSMGSGKTLGVIAITRMRYAQEGRRLKTLIITPLITLRNWENEIKAGSPYDQKTIHVLNQASSKKKAEYLRKNLSSNGTDLDLPDIVIVNYDGIVTPDLATALHDFNPDVVILDEFHLCKNIKAKRTKVARLLSERAKYKMMLSGTAILNSSSDIFAPWLILDKGQTFGDNIFVFQSKYMTDANASWKGRTGYFPKMINNPKTSGELHEKIFQKADRKTTDECVDLPPFIEQIVEVDASPEQKKYYNDMMKLHLAFIEEHEGKSQAATANLALTKSLRLQEIAAGYLKLDNGDIVEFKNNPRMDAAKELVESIIEQGEKVIIWTNFIYTYTMLSKMLTGMKVKHVMLTGQQSIKEKDDAIYGFENDDTIRVVIANAQSASVGINLIAAKYSIVYSRDFSLANYLQAKARNFRGGSEIHDKIIRYELALSKSIDYITLQALRNKMNLSELIIDRKKLISEGSL